MDRQILNITANEQILSVSNPIHISTNKVSYIEARFDLGTNWSGYDSVRAVWFNDFQCISTVLDANGKCLVPFEVMKRKGNIKVNLVGSISENDVLTDRLTSYPIVAVVVDCVAQITGSETSPITPSQFEQFVDNVHDEVEVITEMSATATTLPAGSDATASYNEGVLYLGIPRGAKGDTGATPNISIGTVETLEPNESATASMSGTAENPVLNLGIPQGRQGEATLSQLEQILPTDTASGSIASFSDGCDLFNAKSVVIGIEPKQSGTGTPSPDNVRPISGWTGAEVQRTGKNLCAVNTIPNIGWADDNSELLDVFNSLPNGTYNMSFSARLDTLTKPSATTWIAGFILTNPAQNYNNQANTSSVAVGNIISANKQFVIDDNSRGKFTHAYIYGAGNNSDGAIGKGTLYNIQIELGSTATAYEPYHGTTYPISWQTEAGTVYGGALDVVSGELNVTMGYIASYNGETIGEPWISDRDEYVAGTTPSIGAEVAYTLATPQTYQLTPTDIALLQGTNNVWADCGDTEVTYKADIQGYIDKKINALI